MAPSQFEQEVEHEFEHPSSLRAVKDLAAGAAGGVAQVLIGQPFDIVKVRLQTTTQYSSAFDCATKIFKNEGPIAFYKGTLMPLIGIGACVSVQFGAFHEARRQLEAYNASRGRPSGQLSYSQYYLAGAFAGVTNSVLSGPIEHVRIRLQTQPDGAGRLYHGPFDCIRRMGAMNSTGPLRSLFRGQAVTLWREIQAYGCWFLAFEFLANQEARRTKVARDEMSSIKIAVCGGVAGEALWISSYPFDVIKSKMQTDGFGAGRRYAGMIDCFRQTYVEGGMLGFWRGVGPTLLRAAPVSAGTFAVVELAMRALG